MMSVWRLELTQRSAEDVPGFWGRFWGRVGNPLAWHVAIFRPADCTEFYEYRFGHTRQDALEAAIRYIAEVRAQEKMAQNSREIFYV